MEKETLTNYLKKFNYAFTEKDEKILVKLDFSLQIMVDLSNPEKISITDKLLARNFLTWPFPMSIKGTMIFNFFASIIVFAVFMGIRHSVNNSLLILLFLFAMFWNLNWLFYYLIKAESFKKAMMDLLK